MILKSFYYGDESSEDNELEVAYMVTTPNESISMGSELTFENYYNGLSYTTSPLRHKYETPVTCTFDMFKKICTNNSDVSFNAQEISHIMRWLNSPTIQKFIPVYDEPEYDGLHFFGTFTTINMIYEFGKCIGFTVTFTATSPWGYGEEIINKRSSDVGNWNFSILCDSDNLGYVYPDNVTVKCLADGNLVLANSAETELDKNENNDRRKTVIKNCTRNEVLTFDCVHQVLQTSSANHSSIYNDFNWNFPRLINNSIYNEDNNINISIPCEVTVTYSPIRKVGVIV